MINWVALQPLRDESLKVALVHLREVTISTEETLPTSMMMTLCLLKISSTLCFLDKLLKGEELSTTSNRGELSLAAKIVKTMRT